MCTGDGVDSGMGTSNSSKVVSRTAGWEEVLESVSFCKGSKGLACVVSIHPALKMPYSGALQAWVGHHKVGEFLSNIFASCSPLPCSSALMPFGQEGLMIFHTLTSCPDKRNSYSTLARWILHPAYTERSQNGPTQFIFGISSKQEKFQFTWWRRNTYTVKHLV